MFRANQADEDEEAESEEGFTGRIPLVLLAMAIFILYQNRRAFF